MAGAANKIGAPELIPARMLNELVYCPRLFYIEYVQGEFEESKDTIEGSAEHKLVDKQRGELPEATSDEVIKTTSLMLSSEKAGIIAKIDLVEGDGGQVVPVDYKHGSKPDVPGNIWIADKVQLCAQAIVLRDNGYVCEKAAIYYRGSRERVYAPIDEALINITLDYVKKARDVASGEIPPPLNDSPKCPGCSLVSICLPDETNVLELVSCKDGELDEKVRRLYPARDDAIPAYVSEQGAMVSKQGDELVVKKNGEKIGSARLMEISHLSVMGNVQVSTQTVHELCSRNIPLCYFSTGGWFYGHTTGMSHKNVLLRAKQYEVATNGASSLKLARRFVEGKVRNCRTMLRRNCATTPLAALDELSRLTELISSAESVEELLGLEGMASRVYFMHFKDMLKTEVSKEFDFESRNRRPPKDPTNALLSFVYSLLAKDCTVVLLSVGFDPYMGFLHRPKYGKPALALDLMEEFRPIIGDSVVIGMINNQEVGPDDFVRSGGSVGMSDRCRRAVIGAYERRMDALIRHPVFGYTISYRRILEVQARLISRYLNKEIDEYPIFCTR